MHPVPDAGLSFQRTLAACPRISLAASVAAAAALPALGLPSRGCGVAVADSQESVLGCQAAVLPGILAAAVASLSLLRQTGRHLFRQLLGQLLTASRCRDSFCLRTFFVF